MSQIHRTLWGFEWTLDLVVFMRVLPRWDMGLKDTMELVEFKDMGLEDMGTQG